MNKHRFFVNKQRKLGKINQERKLKKEHENQQQKLIYLSEAGGLRPFIFFVANNTKKLIHGQTPKMMLWW